MKRRLKSIVLNRKDFFTNFRIQYEIFLSTGGEAVLYSKLTDCPHVGEKKKGFEGLTHISETKGPSLYKLI